MCQSQWLISSSRFAWLLTSIWYGCPLPPSWAKALLFFLSLHAPVFLATSTVVPSQYRLASSLLPWYCCIPLAQYLALFSMYIHSLGDCMLSPDPWFQYYPYTDHYPAPKSSLEHHAYVSSILLDSSTWISNRHLKFNSSNVCYLTPKEVQTARWRRDVITNILLHKTLGFLGDTVVKNLPACVRDSGDTGFIPGWGRCPGEGNGNPPQYLAWKIPWTEEPGGLQSMRSQSWTWLSDWHAHTNLYCPSALCSQG